MEELQQRTPLIVDDHGRTLRTGEHEVTVLDGDDPLASYLSMIYAARGIRPGEPLALRDADLNVLAGLVGHDPDQVERRLIELMQISPDEARIIRTLLFKRRTVATAAGLALGLTALFGLDHGSDDPKPKPQPPQATEIYEDPFVRDDSNVVPEGGASSAVLERDGGPQHPPETAPDAP